MWKLLACVSNEVKRLENNHHCLLCFKGPIRIFWIAAIGKIHSLWPSWRLWNDHGSNSGLELDRLDFTFAAVDGLSAAFPPPLKKHLELLSFPYFKSRQCFIYRPRKIWNPGRRHLLLVDFREMNPSRWLRHLTRADVTRSIWLMVLILKKHLAFGSGYPWDVVDNSSPQFWSRRIAKPWQCCCRYVQAKVEQRPSKPTELKEPYTHSYPLKVRNQHYTVENLISFLYYTLKKH